MRKATITLVVALGALVVTSTKALAQYNFEDIVRNPATSVKDQAHSGTCWCFATTSFLESELLRMGKGEFDFSEMFTTRNVYQDRFYDNFLRHGKGSVGPGGVCNTLTMVVAKYGLMPEDVYNGLNGRERHDHEEMHKVLTTLADLWVNMKKNSKEMQQVIDATMDAYMGKVPATFQYKGKEVTPVEYLNVLGLNMDDYIEFTSFSHHPYYKKFVLEIADNWEQGSYYNLPLDEFMELLNTVLKSGYTVGWDGDVSEKGFVRKKGIAILPTAKVFDEALKLEKPMEEVNVTQEIRQQYFETFETTDDHIMHITGLAKDQNGTIYYITKNSWNEIGDYKGYWYMSESFVRGKSISFMVHKSAIPKELKKKLNID